MPRETEYIDEHGVKWITPARAAEIWNERVMSQYQRSAHYQNYTRWSVYQRTNLEKLKLPNETLYREDEIRRVPLRPHPKRPEVAAANKSRKK